MVAGRGARLREPFFTTKGDRGLGSDWRSRRRSSNGTRAGFVRGACVVPGRSGNTFRLLFLLEISVSSLHLQKLICRAVVCRWSEGSRFLGALLLGGLVVQIGKAGNEGTADSSNLEQGEYAATETCLPMTLSWYSAMLRLSRSRII